MDKATAAERFLLVVFPAEQAEEIVGDLLESSRSVFRFWLGIAGVLARTAQPWILGGLAGLILYTISVEAFWHLSHAVRRSHVANSLVDIFLLYAITVSMVLCMALFRYGRQSALVKASLLAFFSYVCVQFTWLMVGQSRFRALAALALPLFFKAFRQSAHLLLACLAWSWMWGSRPSALIYEWIYSHVYRFLYAAFWFIANRNGCDYDAIWPDTLLRNLSSPLTIVATLIPFCGICLGFGLIIGRIEKRPTFAAKQGRAGLLP